MKESIYDQNIKPPICAVCTCEKNGTRFFLTADGYASDIPQRAKIFRDGSDAHFTGIRISCLPEWKGFDWHGRYMTNNYKII